MIGVFDSGVGGLSVWREIAPMLPAEPMIYLADQAHVPYGPRSLGEVRALTTASVTWLVKRGCDVVVIACNTASAAALRHLRAVFPHVPFVGMEPAVKPAALHTHTGVIGVLATQATFQGELFASVVARYAAGVQVVEQPCPGWVELVEAGIPSGTQPQVIAQYVVPLLEAGADALVLGCTHFPFLAAHIQSVVDAWAVRQACPYEVALVDPSMAVARQTMRVRNNRAIETFGAREQPASTAITPYATTPAVMREFWTTGDPDVFAHIAGQLMPQLSPLHARELDLREPVAMQVPSPAQS